MPNASAECEERGGGEGGGGACAQAFPPDFPYSPSPLVQASQDYVYVAG